MSGHFLDGEPVPPDYLARVSALINDCFDAEDEFGPDYLEPYAAELAKLESNHNAR